MLNKFILRKINDFMLVFILLQIIFKIRKVVLMKYLYEWIKKRLHCHLLLFLLNHLLFLLH